MSRWVFGSQRSLDETGRPLGPMVVRTLADVAVTSWMDAERRPSSEDELDADDDEEEDEVDVSLVLELSLEDVLEIEFTRARPL